MSRHILFRGKTRKGEWVYGVYYKQDHYYNEKVEKNCIITSTDTLGNDMDLDFCEVIPETVGQFTGLTDKNGKKIFEGDIVRVKGKQTEENWKDYDEFGKVVFENGAFLIKVANIFNGKKYFSEVHCRYMTTADWVEREVIGNVFENKELLGENK